MAVQIGQVELDAPGESFATAEQGSANFDLQDFICRDDDGVKEKPRLQLQPVGINPVFLPQVGRRAARNINWRLKPAQAGLSISTPLVSVFL